MSNGTETQRWRDVMMMGATQAPTLHFVRGEGARLWDAAGKEYTDFVAGVAVNSLGHAHPAVVAAVSKQIAQLGHVSNLYMADTPVALAERLLGLFDERFPNGRVFFGNSGAEVNEAAFKIARRTGRPRIVSAQNSFHGRTLAALALTGQPGKHKGFEPLPGPIDYVPYSDIEAIAHTVTPATAAVFLEAIQGEGGVVVPSEKYLHAAREITQEAGALLVIDEVQTGIGRTGAWFAHTASDIQPDVVNLAKGLGGGLPIGACIAFGEAAELLQAGQHASTFGGNPVAAAAALAVLDTIETTDLLDHVTDVGARLRNGIRALQHPLITEVRGRGLMLGVQLERDVAGAVQQAAQNGGFLVNAVTSNTLRLVPPLVIEAWQVDAFLGAFPSFLDVGLA